MIYTSRFSNPELKSGKYTVVGIVRGLPRFKLGYERAGNIIDIAPTKELFNVYDRAEFTEPYKRHLDSVGIEKINAQIEKYFSLGKDVVLCCYEDVRIPGEWCHRLVFAEWWLENTGEVIAELKDESPIKIKRGKVSVPSTRGLTELFPQAARWLENAKVDAAGRYYIVPEISYKNFEAHENWNPVFYIVTNDLKLRRIGFEFMKKLVACGQAIEINKQDITALNEK